MSGRVEHFRDLRVYRAAYDAGMEIFRVSGSFPSDERYSLTSQIRRSSRSVATNTAEAWRKRRYPAAFVSKLSDAEAEAAETRSHLDFALGCGYIDRPTYRRLDGRYVAITRQLVRMISQAPRWTPGRASGRPAGKARVSLTSPSLREGRREVESAPDPEPSTHLPQSPGSARNPERPRSRGPAQ